MTIGAPPTIPPVLENRPSGHSGRLRLWEIRPLFYCSVVGLCSSIANHKKILRQAGLSTSAWSPAKVHGTMVQYCKSANRVSKHLEKYLNRKYHSELSKFGNLEPDRFLAAWREKLSLGEVAGLLWTAVSRPDLAEAHLDQIFDDLHMLSFRQINEWLQEKRSLARLEAKKAELEQRLAAEGRQRRSLAKDKKVLEMELHKLQRQYRLLDKTRHQLEASYNRSESPEKSTSDTETRVMRTELERLRSQVKAYTRQEQAWQAREHQLTEKLTQQRALNHQLRQEKIQSAKPQCEKCNEHCPNFDLCAQRILLVGGITKIEPFYRELVENNGGHFEYHDGYMQQGHKKLADRIKRSDVVLCPLSCNSHAAARGVKKLCRKLQKPFHPVPGSSLESVGQALRKIAAGGNNSNS